MDKEGLINRDTYTLMFRLHYESNRLYYFSIHSLTSRNLIENLYLLMRSRREAEVNKDIAKEHTISPGIASFSLSLIEDACTYICLCYLENGKIDKIEKLWKDCEVTYPHPLYLLLFTYSNLQHLHFHYQGSFESIFCKAN